MSQSASSASAAPVCVCDGGDNATAVPACCLPAGGVTSADVTVALVAGLSAGGTLLLCAVCAATGIAVALRKRRRKGHPKSGAPHAAYAPSEDASVAGGGGSATELGAAAPEPTNVAVPAPPVVIAAVPTAVGVASGPGDAAVDLRGTAAATAPSPGVSPARVAAPPAPPAAAPPATVEGALLVPAQPRTRSNAVTAPTAAASLAIGAGIRARGLSAAMLTPVYAIISRVRGLSTTSRVPTPPSAAAGGGGGGQAAAPQPASYSRGGDAGGGGGGAALVLSPVDEEEAPLPGGLEAPAPVAPAGAPGRRIPEAPPPASSPYHAPGLLPLARAGPAPMSPLGGGGSSSVPRSSSARPALLAPPFSTPPWAAHAPVDAAAGAMHGGDDVYGAVSQRDGGHRMAPASGMAASSWRGSGGGGHRPSPELRGFAGGPGSVGVGGGGGQSFNFLPLPPPAVLPPLRLAPSVAAAGQAGSRRFGGGGGGGWPGATRALGERGRGGWPSPAAAAVSPQGPDGAPPPWSGGAASPSSHAGWEPAAGFSPPPAAAAAAAIRASPLLLAVRASPPPTQRQYAGAGAASPLSSAAPLSDRAHAQHAVLPVFSGSSDSPLPQGRGRVVQQQPLRSGRSPRVSPPIATREEEATRVHRGDAAAGFGEAARWGVHGSHSSSPPLSVSVPAAPGEAAYADLGAGLDSPATPPPPAASPARALSTRRQAEQSPQASQASSGTAPRRSPLPSLPPTGAGALGPLARPRAVSGAVGARPAAWTADAWGGSLEWALSAAASTAAGPAPRPPTPPEKAAAAPSQRLAPLAEAASEPQAPATEALGDPPAQPAAVPPPAPSALPHAHEQSSSGDDPEDDESVLAELFFSRHRDTVMLR